MTAGSMAVGCTQSHHASEIANSLLLSRTFVDVVVTL